MLRRAELGVPFLYQALQSPEQFVAYADGILGRAEAVAHLYRQEVRAERAVVAAGNRDVLAAEDARIALHGPGQRLCERVVSVAAEELVDDVVRVAAQHALILLAGFHGAVAAQDGLQTDG